MRCSNFHLTITRIVVLSKLWKKLYVIPTMIAAIQIKKIKLNSRMVNFMTVKFGIKENKSKLYQI